MSSIKPVRRNPNIVTRIIDGEAVLLPIYRTSKEMNCIYSLNNVATRVWEMINGRRTLKAIRNKCLREFNTTPDEVDKKLYSFFKDLKEIKAWLNPPALGSSFKGGNHKTQARTPKKDIHKTTTKNNKPRFRPVITRVKLNPEQAVLSCNCYNAGHDPGSSDIVSDKTICEASTKGIVSWGYSGWAGYATASS